MLSHFNKFQLFHNKYFCFTNVLLTVDAGVKKIGTTKCTRRILWFVAFVHHNTLIIKPRRFEIGNKSLDILVSFLNERIQKVSINRIRSTGAAGYISVSQG